MRRLLRRARPIGSEQTSNGRETEPETTSGNRDTNINNLIPTARVVQPYPAEPVANTRINRLRNLVQRPVNAEASVISGPVHYINQNITDNQPNQRQVRSYRGITPDDLDNTLTRTLGKSSQDRARAITTERRDYHNQRAAAYRHGGHVQRLERQNSDSSQSSNYSVAYY